MNMKNEHNMTGGDFALSAGWDHLGAGGAVMPGRGRIAARPCATTAAVAMVAP